MGESANISSIDSLKAFRIALIKFQEAALVALAEGEGDLTGTLHWLETEQYPYWNGQIRKRHEAHERAKEALRMKQLFKDSSGRIPSAVEEQKAVQKARNALEEANEKLANVKKYGRVLVRELQTYKGSVQRFATTVVSDLPVAAAQLGQLVNTLEEYASLAPADTQQISAAPSNEKPPE